jgi:mRNA interferase RelE/StbE
MAIRYSKAAIKTLSAMPVNTAKRIMAKVEQYAADPASLANTVKKLQGRDGYRLRIGAWRVIFDHDGVALDVLQIGPRGSVYED